MNKRYSQTARHKEMLKYFVIKYKPKCYFCRKPMDWRVFFPKLNVGKEDWTPHHLNENHEDNRPENVELSHRSCHRAWHKQNPIK